jgi:hypothetical protein
MKGKFKEELVGEPVNTLNIPNLLLILLLKEAREETEEAIDFINKIAAQRGQYKENEGEQENSKRNTQCRHGTLAPNKSGGQNQASKTQGMLPQPQR